LRPLQFADDTPVSTLTFGSLAGNIALVAVLHYGGTLVITGVMSVGELMSFVLYTAWIAAALGILTSVFNDFMKSIGASQRVFELLDRMPAIPPSASGPQTVQIQHP